MPSTTSIATLLLEPWLDAMSGMDHAIGQSGLAALPILFLAMFASWWIYVPLHELMHAWGCLFSGGVVTRLEIDEIYGAAWLATLFPYVVPGSDYAGRLSGFDTGGSDAIYLVTVFFPYLLTLFPGVMLLQLSAHLPRHAAWALGASLPVALTPFLSLTGDYFEIGSIIVSGLLANTYPEGLTRWRGDDFLLVWSSLPAAADNWFDRIGLIASLTTGMMLAVFTYALGAGLAGRLLHR